MSKSTFKCPNCGTYSDKKSICNACEIILCSNSCISECYGCKKCFCVDCFIVCYFCMERFCIICDQLCDECRSPLCENKNFYSKKRYNTDDEHICKKCSLKVGGPCGGIDDCCDLCHRYACNRSKNS